MNLNLLGRAKSGDMDARNELIEKSRGFIHRYACFVCKRYLSWQNDDELSISLMAFNSAIDSFNEGNFQSYCKMVIKNRLIDYFRKNSRSEVPIDDTIINNLLYTNNADERLDREAQINIFKEKLLYFNIEFSDLVRNSPKHKDTRKKLIDLANEVSNNEKIVQILLKRKTLPIKEIQSITNVSRKLLEEWRKYIISLILIFSDDKLDSIKDFII